MTTAEAADRFQAELRDALARILDQLKSALARKDTWTAAQAREIAGNLAIELSDARLRAIYAKAVDAAITSAGLDLDALGVAARIAGPAEATLKALAGKGLDDLLRVAADHRDELRRVVVESLTTLEQPADAIAALEAKLGGAASQVGSLVDTTLFGVDRSATIAAGEEAGVEAYEYTGPMDSLTRDWCAARVGKVFAADELDRESNDTGPQPPSIYAGGWRCRHRWTPVMVVGEGATWFYPGHG